MEDEEGNPGEIEVVQLSEGEYIEEEDEELKEPEADHSKLKFGGHKDSVYCINVNHSRSLAISGDGDDKAILWDVNTGNQISLLEGHTDSVVGAQFTADQNLIITASLDNTVKVWNLEENSCSLRHTMEGPSDEITFLSLHPKGNVALVGGQDMTLWMFNCENGELMNAFSGHCGIICQGGFVPSGKLAYSVSGDNTIRLWKPASGESKIIKADKLEIQGELNAACCHPKEDQPIIIGGTQEGAIVFGNYKTFKYVHKLNIPNESIESVDISPITNFSAIGHSSGKISIIDTTSGALRNSTMMDDVIVKCQFSQKDPIMYAGCLDGSIGVIDPRKGGLAHRFQGHYKGILDFCLSKDESILVSAGDDGKCLIFDTKFSQIIIPLQLYQQNTSK
eukprot:TRINITY_DN769_c0_g1_i1.p1 TRINITY_DN769_c0_g1~~TRINITY_DN769_c0_g1_i1.p1  ORF type:complete len:409 (+),score=58.02 TRINITY_DN769_c0_g1_i1:51-1229(+)